jgi:hypothetical protein
MADEHELPLDHGDLVGVLRLALPLHQRPAALWARPPGLGQRVSTGSQPRALLFRTRGSRGQRDGEKSEQCCAPSF